MVGGDDKLRKIGEFHKKEEATNNPTFYNLASLDKPKMIVLFGGFKGPFSSNMGGIFYRVF